jgi:Mut7-C ubiquitin
MLIPARSYPFMALPWRMAGPLRQERVSVLIWFHDGLDYFLKPDQRQPQPIRRAIDCRTAVKDLIESCGVPHSEVDLIHSRRSVVLQVCRVAVFAASLPMVIWGNW